ncbi:hypothetical protein KY285_012228 [Solanum tuberosum]|nr:hypothetical protein KY289_010991 [Solanum tuberosum]KAH0736521.1 hypothetical protein KY285_012228 [Solanum tuberosum]
MSNTSPIGESLENIMEVLANISKQVAEMNGRMGGMEKRLVRVENENRRKAIQPEYEEIRRASVHSSTLAPGQAHNLCSPPQNRTQNYQHRTFQPSNPANHLRQPMPHPNPQLYPPPQENIPFVAYQEFNNEESWEHGGRDGNGVQGEGVRPRDLGWYRGMGDQEYGNRGDRMGYIGDMMGYRGDRIGNRGNRFSESNDHQDRGLNTIKAKYALTQFEGYASTWWESKRRERESHHNYELPTWQELIALMELRYLTPNYYNEVLKKVYMLRQGTKSVKEYYDEFENLRMKSKIEENMECMVIRFVENLRYNILKPLKLKHYETLEAAFHDASKVEENLKEEKSYKAKSSLTSTWRKDIDNWKTTSSREKPKGGGQAAQVKLDYKSKASKQPQGGKYVKPNFPRPSIIQCFRCQGRGHVARECPNRRTIVALRYGYKTEDEKEGEEKNEGEGDRGEGEEGASGDEEERLDERVNFSCFMEKGKSLLDDDEDLNMNFKLSCVVRRIIGALAKEELNQRENLFHAR